MKLIILLFENQAINPFLEYLHDIAIEIIEIDKI